MTIFSPFEQGSFVRPSHPTMSAQNDNGAISPVIQTTNRSRVPKSRLRTDVRPSGKDARSNAEHKVEQKR